MLQNTRRWKCLRELDKAIVMDTDEPLVLEEREDAKGPPPNRSYPVPKALLPQLSAFIEELLNVFLGFCKVCVFLTGRQSFVIVKYGLQVFVVALSIV